MHRHDQQNATNANGEKRNLSQCLADALDHLTTTGSGGTGSGDSDRTTGGSTTGGSATGGGAGGSEDNEGTTGGGTAGSGSTTGSGDGTTGGGTTGSGTTAGGSGEPYVDLCVVAHVDDDTGKLVGELPDGSRLPQSVLDELTCNAAITAAIFDRCGKPIWRTTTGRRATETQRRILKARWGGCFHCRANFAICQPHHINPVSQGGPTSIDNLVPACWACHNLIHRDGWQIHKSPDGNHTLHPPQHIHHGPAHTPEQPPPTITQPPPLFDESPRPHAPQHETQLFATEPDPAVSEAADTETAPARPDSILANRNGLPSVSAADTETTPARPDRHDSEATQTRTDSDTARTGSDSDDPEATQAGPDRGINGQWDLPRDDSPRRPTATTGTAAPHINGQWDLPRDDSETSRTGPDRSDAKTTRAGPAAARAALEAARAILNGAQQTHNQQRPATAR